MSSNQFRLFIAGAIVVLIVGWLGWGALQRSQRIQDCVDRGWANDPDLRAQCEAAERAGHLQH